MGNIQTNEKHTKGKSPAKGKNFIRNLNRKSSGRDSRKHGKKKDGKRDAIDRELDKTPDSDNIEHIDDDNDTVECVFKTVRDAEGEEVAASRCARSPTLGLAASPSGDSESVFTDPLTPLAVELNQCYYSAESDSAHDEAPRTLTPADAPAQHSHPSLRSLSPTIDIEMPHDDTASALSASDADREEKNDAYDNDSDEKVMGAVYSGSKSQRLERGAHECNHEFRENRLKACPGQTSFTLSKHRKVELPPVACDSALLDNDKDRRHSSLSDAPPSDSNVLRKVASLTLEKLTDAKVVRPKFVPEKLDFHLHEKFEGNPEAIVEPPK